MELFASYSYYVNLRFAVRISIPIAVTQYILKTTAVCGKPD
ncbi:hypothetical protein HMPREF3208_01438 [Gardnerella vaginalis]|uniref:Uncharacterized protein n=1 Tax=Gardnerella vaginalis TaxID=2702 RepID=A0A133NNM0_GARVA|nr:hypothetical protein HMPREF3208_01438 [Gardnerella vaginalis]